MIKKLKKIINERKEVLRRLLTLEENVRTLNSATNDISNILKNQDSKIAFLDENQRKFHSKTLGELNSLEDFIKNDRKSNQNNIKNESSSENLKSSYYQIDYFDFEDRFRGDRESIKKVQTQYLKYFKNKKNVLDLGCGRGEFLELLKENNISCTGIDNYPVFIEYCKSKDLNVVKMDVIEYLKTIKFTDGIFVGQLVEHLGISQIMELCDLAYKKMKKGSYLVIETPNPMSLAIYSHAFYIDPSHVKPVHPLLLNYILERVGFREINIIYTETSKLDITIPKLVSDNIKNIDEFNSSMKKVEETLFGSQDYAIIAKK